MSISLTKRLTRVALLAGFMLPAVALFAQPSQAAPAAPPAAAAQDLPVVQAPVASTDEETIANFKQVLAQYGKFIEVAPYGEVWVPTVTPEGWHPYPPCHWIYAQDVGWYFRDDTPWGAIVHHYGRWSHNAKLGWFWVPDADWSPGWVVWRNNADYTGWAPMPPDVEAQQVSLDTFNKDKMWIFMETPLFMKGCGDAVLASTVYDETDPVTIFELPRGHIVRVHIITRWKTRVIRRIVVIDRHCPRRPNIPPTHLIPLRPNNPPPTRTLYDTLQPPPSHGVIEHPRHDRVRHLRPSSHRISRHPGRRGNGHVQRLRIHTLKTGKVYRRHVGNQTGTVGLR